MRSSWKPRRGFLEKVASQVDPNDGRRRKEEAVCHSPDIKKDVHKAKERGKLRILPVFSEYSRST